MSERLVMGKACFLEGNNIYIDKPSRSLYAEGRSCKDNIRINIYTQEELVQGKALYTSGLSCS
jgi:hypothetical protein